MNATERVAALRIAMKKRGVSAVIVPTSDPHQSEYVPKCWEDRAWISGFSGSAGIAVVTHSDAALWTDARYFLSAEKELKGGPFVLHKQLKRFEPEHLIRLAGQLKAGDRVAVDGRNITFGQKNQMLKYFDPADIELVFDDLVSSVWTNRPSIPTAEIFEHTAEHCGESRAVKLKAVQAEMAKLGADFYLFSGLDEIAWLTNLRGSDVDFNPVFISYGLLHTNGLDLYVHSGKISSTLEGTLSADGVTLKDYDAIEDDLRSLSETDQLLLDPSLINAVLYDAVAAQIVASDSLIHSAKGIKSPAELDHIGRVMIKDGIALAQAFFWLENTLKDRSVSEAEFADCIAASRSRQPHYYGESFPAIVGFDGNGAIIHYRPEHGTCSYIEGEGILLCDSGGQYFDGTTDITRTIALGSPPEWVKNHFTLVLKGMIALTKMVFPVGTSGGQLDIMSRQFLWAQGLDFKHGTGHGVGFFLNVHEGPHSIGPLSNRKSKIAFAPGMIVTNEPGYYEEGRYGIRIENILVCKESNKEGFLCFDTLTLYPIDQALMDESKLNRAEKAWINQYHHKVWTAVGPHLSGDLKEWFKIKCRPLN